jgi:signal transduction histidine kinase
MARLFTRLYLMMAAVLVVSLVLDWLEETYLERVLPQREVSANAAFGLLEYALASKPPASWPAEVARIRQRVPTFQAPTTVDALNARKVLAPGDEISLMQGALVYWTGSDNSTSFARRLGTGPTVAEIRLADPIPRVLILWSNMAVLELLFVAIAMWCWVRPLWRDLRRLDQATAELAQGQFDTRVALRPRSVLYPLAQSFNWMAEHIGALLNSHRALTNAVSHELRTPLARLRFALSLAAEDPSLAGKDQQLQRMRHDLDELDALSSELLTLAKLERAVEGSLVDDAFPASEWLEDRLTDARATAQAFGQHVSFTANCGLDTLHGNPQLLARALDNLLNNAARHAVRQVDVHITDEPGTTCIIVDDDGPGIPDSAREHVFEPFVQLDASRDRVSGGVGLGLAIVRQIVRAHGGQISVSQSPTGGARFRIELAPPP